MKPDAREIFGGEIQYFRMEPRYWEKTVKALADAGLRTVTSYVQWAPIWSRRPTRPIPPGCWTSPAKRTPG